MHCVPYIFLLNHSEKKRVHCSLWMSKNFVNNFLLVLSPSCFEHEHFISNILRAVKYLKQNKELASNFTVNTFMLI